MRDEDYQWYPYRAQNMMCKHDGDKIMGKPTHMFRIFDDLDQVKDTLKITPLTLAVSARVLKFRYYKSGILTSEDCSGWLDHAVVLVGLKKRPIDPNAEPEPVVTCKMNKWWRQCTTTYV